ncbi:MAG: exodeoxyribonuclease VII small subunit [Gammaproteobacteria bacterium]|nr:exodeoxyribonuclease VII small subunit [Gammaproteobacteria bacterium]|tara:strand:- start:775 stop:975 length:201 start_codon:yes stop_codon:yes gene_type:complete
MNKKKDNNISSFENDLKSLQKILEDIEKDDLSLEMMIKKYQEGVEISKKCQKTLQEAEQKIKEIKE